MSTKTGPFSSAADLSRKLGSKQNVLNSETIKVRQIRSGHMYNGGRALGTKDLPPFLREVIGLTAISNGIAATARAFDMSPDAVGGYVKGATRYSREANAEMQRTMDSTRKEIKDRVIDTATQRLLTTVGLISEEEISGIGPVAQAKVAVSLAGVVDKLTEKKEQQLGIQLGVVVYSPNLKQENDYPTVEAVIKA